MRKLVRAPEPLFLASKCQEWGEDWRQRQANGQPFYWHHIDGKPVNQQLLPLLREQTQDHCSFCDHFPVDPPSIATIEHFRPKAMFPLEAFQWSNLFFACTHCQQKGTAFTDIVLAPDAAHYEFDRYFRWDHTKGTLEVNDSAAPEDRPQAEATIAYFRLNVGHPTQRKIQLIRRSKHQDESLDTWPYRDYLAGPEPIPEEA
jgi:uncharacterized protein (TIGR02646 family)